MDGGRRYTGRRRALLAGLLFVSAVVLARGVQLQVVEGAVWESRARDQHRQRVELPAPRGTIFDRNGVPLVVSQEVYRIAVAPGELRDAAAAARELSEVLGLSPERAARAVDPSRRWVVLPGLHDTAVKRRLDRIRGLHFERVLERSYPNGELALEILGRVTSDGRALGGIEQALDSLLAGRPGVAVARRDARGEAIPGSLMTVIEPVPGHDVHLTLDHLLQEIADGALREAIEGTGSSGGDLIFADPRTGEILAAVSRREGGDRHWRGVTEPYEPGSTLKPFTVAALLAEGRATLADSVYAEEGRWRSGGRTFTDTREHGWLTLRDALSLSSNIAMAKVSERIEPTRQFEYLRGFGFGTPTGVGYTSEASGLLRRPSEWSRYSPASLAIGYEVAVTPLQMVMAYGALANGGVLLEPRLVREVRSRDGRTLERFDPRAVRRVVPESVAREVGSTLVDVVEAGTGQAAGLGVFRVAGKTGTARRVSAGSYERGAYTASFAGYFPADDPQLTFLVKLDRPSGEYYGGQAAAPVTRATLAAALAAHGSVLDRGAVIARSGAIARAEEPEVIEARGAGTVSEPEPAMDVSDAMRWVPPASGPFIFALDAMPPERYRPERVALRTVPDVRGLSRRDAARRLHEEGLRVEVEGRGEVVGTVPAIGARVEAGSVVRLRGREGR